jgi:hypothetical protein
MKKYIGNFQDFARVETGTKNAVSIRDGILEYAGAELGMSPADKIFRIYRSPATIANAAMGMLNIPLTDGHVAFTDSPPASGSVLSAEMFDAADAATHTTIAVRNKLSVSDEIIGTVSGGAKQLSLGYQAELHQVTNKDYEFEQRNIKPHHLAVVDSGRCGAMCSFIDEIKPHHKPKQGHSMDKLMQLLQKFADSQADGKQKMTDDDIRAMAIDAVPELIEKHGKQFADKAGVIVGAVAATFADAMPKSEIKQMFADKNSQEFADAVGKAVAEALPAQVKQHVTVVETARKHLPEDYQFADKSCQQIMRDAIKTQNQNDFTDSELPIAFKMLSAPQPKSQYANFGDTANGNKWADVGEQTIGGDK